MTDLTISGEVAKQLRERADREQRPVEDVLAALLASAPPPSAPEPPQEVLDAEVAEQAALAAVRPNLYAIAREYWERVGDEARLALTDEELDEQFWLIDHEGIPRLKSEESTIELPPDPLALIEGIFDSDVTDASTTVRETLEKYTHPQYGWTSRDRTD